MNAAAAHLQDFYINGHWVAAAADSAHDIENPATEEVCATVALATPDDVDRAVRAARAAFIPFGQSAPAERATLLERIFAGCEARAEELARAMTLEMGAPISLSRAGQVGAAQAILKVTIDYLKEFQFEESRGRTRIFKVPAGVCALITPWNWPLLQIICKVAPALAAGCTVVLKPSELAPLSGLLFADIVDQAGLPAGVFNLVNGTGAIAGQALVGHPDVDVVSFTGSTRAGIAIGKEAAGTVKRVRLELGGKSPNLILPDADVESAVRRGVEQCFNNTGQNCNAPSRMLVPERELSRAIAIAQAAAEAHVVGDPWSPSTVLGPLGNKPQFEWVQRMIQQGVAGGAALVTGGVGRPPGLDRGYYARPTVFANVLPHMTIAREEIFGPVLSIMPYRDEESAIAIANDTIYGLAANVFSGDLRHARQVAARLRVGRVTLNEAPWDSSAPTGGFKQSGIGREYADYGIAEFLEIQSIVGFDG